MAIPVPTTNGRLLSDDRNEASREYRYLYDWIGRARVRLQVYDFSIWHLQIAGENGLVMKRFSDACRRNREPILEVLRDVVPDEGLVFEVGSGTGQHAAYFGAQLPNLTWQPSDRGDDHESIIAWRDEAGVENVRDPVRFNLFDDEPPIEQADAVVCINTIHIAPWEATSRLFEHASELLTPGDPIYLYGPFRYRDRELEESNEKFDRYLQERNPESGLRQFERVDDVAEDAGFRFVDDVAMPANNRSIWWRLAD